MVRRGRSFSFLTLILVFVLIFNLSFFLIALSYWLYWMAYWYLPIKVIKLPEIKGKVVDKETGKGIKDAIIVTYTAKIIGSDPKKFFWELGHPRQDYRRAKSDKNGNFILPAKWAFTPYGLFNEEEFFIEFAVGYKHDRFDKKDNKITIKLIPVFKNPDEYYKYISELEIDFDGSWELSKEEALCLINEYKNFVRLYPMHKEAPHVLSMAGGIAEHYLKDKDLAEAFEKEIFSRYPNSFDAKRLRELKE